MSVFIGIDAPKGFAVWDPVKKRVLDVRTSDFWGIIALIEAWLKIEPSSVVRVEDPNFNKPTFFRPVQTQRAMRKISQNVGMNKESASLIIDYCNMKGYACEPVPPIRGELKKWKNDRNLFERQTGWRKLTSEHGRDAIALVYGL
jgi:hypothetical protein